MEPPPLHTLPEDHPDRNRPLVGASFRVHHIAGEDINTPLEDRGPTWRHKKWSRWREVLPSWHISEATYNDLGPTWTSEHEWRFPSP